MAAIVQPDGAAYGGPMVIVYKICPQAEWLAAVASGTYGGSAADRRDGFIHLSAAHQLGATAARHFAGQKDLVVVAFAADALPGLRWEVSRGGALFPHVYGELLAAAALWARDLPLEGGCHRLPEGVA